MFDALDAATSAADHPMLARPSARSVVVGDAETSFVDPDRVIARRLLSVRLPGNFGTARQHLALGSDPEAA